MLDFLALSFQYQHDKCILCLWRLPEAPFVSRYSSTLDMSPARRRGCQAGLTITRLHTYRSWLEDWTLR